MDKILKIGIMGGTFDPIHIGHLVTAEEARTQFKLDEVIFVPSGRPPHKKAYNVSDAQERFKMTELAISSNAFFRVSPIETERAGYSYAADTVSEFRKLFGEMTKIYFITGADAILEILTWKNVNTLMQECYFIAATRPGYNLQETNEKYLNFPEVFKERIFFMEIPALSISSTDIRARVKAAKTIKYLVPETVENYICKNHLYL